jgi:predicted transcriptional regulator
MNIVRRMIEIDATTDERLRALAAERGRDEAALLAEAVALLDSMVDIGAPDTAEDRRRLDEFRHAPEGVSLAEVKAWVDSWGTVDERPRPISKTPR